MENDKGNHKNTTDPEGGKTEFVYDAANRLTKVRNLRWDKTVISHVGSMGRVGVVAMAVTSDKYYYCLYITKN